MREIKFKVLKEKDKSVIGYERINKDGQWEHQYDGRSNWLLGAITYGQEYMKLIRLQFSGLLDKNGKDIYEGDIDVDGGSVEWNKDDASFFWNYPEIEAQPMGEENEWCEIIGNIHQNPELLK